MEKARPSDRWIPIGIVAFFVFFMALLSGFAWIAFHTYTGQVTEDAYKKGLAYNAQIASAEAQTKLGWTGELQATGHDRALELRFTLRDAAGHSIGDAAVVARCVRPSQAGHDAEIRLHYAHGVYSGTASLDFPGVWDIHISATRGGDNYQQLKTVILQ